MSILQQYRLYEFLLLASLHVLLQTFTEKCYSWTGLEPLEQWQCLCSNWVLKRFFFLGAGFRCIFRTVQELSTKFLTQHWETPEEVEKLDLGRKRQLRMPKATCYLIPSHFSFSSSFEQETTILKFFQVFDQQRNKTQGGIQRCLTRLRTLEQPASRFTAELLLKILAGKNILWPGINRLFILVHDF